MICKKQKGTALYYAIIIMGISLAVALGLNTIAVQSLKTTREIEKSPPALYGADTGVERALYERSQGNWDPSSGGGPGGPPGGPGGPPGSGSFSHSETLDDSDGTTYDLTIYASSTPPCNSTDAKLYCVYSVGKHKGAKRVIRIVR